MVGSGCFGEHAPVPFGCIKEPSNIISVVSGYLVFLRKEKLFAMHSSLLGKVDVRKTQI